VDFWPLVEGEDGALIAGGHEEVGTQIENPSQVSARANKYFQLYNTFGSNPPIICLSDVDYVMYSQFALRDRKQFTGTQGKGYGENAPLAVERIAAEDNCDANDCNDFDNAKTNIEVWRYSFVTDDLATFRELMNKDFTERVVSSAGLPTPLLPAMLAAVAIAVLRLF